MPALGSIDPFASMLMTCTFTTPELSSSPPVPVQDKDMCACLLQKRMFVSDQLQPTDKNESTDTTGHRHCTLLNPAVLAAETSELILRIARLVSAVALAVASLSLIARIICKYPQT